MARVCERVSSYLESEIDRGTFPGAQYAIADGGEIVAEGALGNAVVQPERIPVTLSTIFDLASLTKPLVMSLISVILAERGELDLNAPASLYVKELGDREDKRTITVTQLLTHTSGFQRWLPFYRELSDPGELPGAISASELLPSSNGLRPAVYSDLNYILLGLLLERISSKPLDELARQEIFSPLRLARTMFNPPAKLKREIAATAEETAVIWGVAHDANARFSRGVSGHAGLFSMAREVFRVASQYLPGSKLLSNLSLGLFTENLTLVGDTQRSMAWVLASTPDCAAGPSLPQ